MKKTIFSVIFAVIILSMPCLASDTVRKDNGTYALEIPKNWVSWRDDDTILGMTDNGSGDVVFYSFSRKSKLEPEEFIESREMVFDEKYGDMISMHPEGIELEIKRKDRMLIGYISRYLTQNGETEYEVMEYSEKIHGRLFDYYGVYRVDDDTEKHRNEMIKVVKSLTLG